MTTADIGAGPATLTARLRTKSGTVLPMAGGRWVAPADDLDEHVLALVSGPVLDLGCGPGRHTEALATRGITVLGIDLSNHAVAMARSKGIAVLERSVFDSIPKSGEWASALLLDGNIGIGGDPVRLLGRVASLLRSEGLVFVEVETGKSVGDIIVEHVRLELDDEPGPWFRWAHVNHTAIPDLAAKSSLIFADNWTVDNRHFAILRKP